MTMHAAGSTEGRPSGVGRAGSALLGRPWLLTILLASGLCVAYLIGVFVNWGDAADRSLYANLGMIPIGLAATILAASASKTQADRRSQWAWRLLAAGLGCFLAGDVLFFVYQNVIGSTPFPSLADAGYLAYYPLALAGLLFFPGLPKGRAPPGYSLSGLLHGRVGRVDRHTLLLPASRLFSRPTTATSPTPCLSAIRWATCTSTCWDRVGAAAKGVGAPAEHHASLRRPGGRPGGRYCVRLSEHAGHVSVRRVLRRRLHAFVGSVRVGGLCRSHAGIVTRRRERPTGNVRRVGYSPPVLLCPAGCGLLVYVNRSQLGTDQGLVILAAAGLVLLSLVRQVQSFGRPAGRARFGAGTGRGR